MNSFFKGTTIKPLFLPGQRTLFGIQNVLGQLLDFIWSGRLDIGLSQRWWLALLKIPPLHSCLRINYEMKVLLAPSLARDPTLITSIRYLATGISYHREQSSISWCSDKKNGFRNFVMSVMVEMGVHKKGDPLDPDGLKAKLVFGITQLIYTLITIIPVSIQLDTLTSSDWFSWSLFQTLFFFSSYALSCSWMVLVYSWGTWNGACYYIEVSRGALLFGTHNPWKYVNV